MSKTVRFDNYGGIEVLEVRDVARPEPGPDQVLVAVRAAGINPSEEPEDPCGPGPRDLPGDLSQRRGIGPRRRRRGGRRGCQRRRRGRRGGPALPHRHQVERLFGRLDLDSHRRRRPSLPRAGATTSCPQRAPHRRGQETRLDGSPASTRMARSPTTRSTSRTARLTRSEGCRERPKPRKEGQTKR
jgi:hypothetical protein